MIRTVIFDLGKVIIPFDFARGYAGMSEACGLPVEVVRSRIPAPLVREFESGRIAPEDFVAQLSAAIGAELEYARFCTIWSSIFLPETLIPEWFVLALKRKYRLVILSNTNAIHFEMVWENYPILHHFDALVLSHKVRAMKPEAEIYRAAIEAAQCAAEECFYTDDILEYVEAARKHGIQAVQFESFEQVARELKARGVTWEE